MWSTNVDEKKLIVSGQQLSPITYVFQRIALGFDHTAVQYYSAVKMIVGSSLNRHSETQTEFRTNENNQQSTPKKLPARETGRRVPSGSPAWLPGGSSCVRHEFDIVAHSNQRRNHDKVFYPSA